MACRQDDLGALRAGQPGRLEPHPGAASDEDHGLSRQCAPLGRGRGRRHGNGTPLCRSSTREPNPEKTARQAASSAVRVWRMTDASPRIVIDPYDPEWPVEFAGVQALIQESLGDLAIRVDHIGSTSVPGLAAKDVIDIQVTVADLNDPRLDPAFERAGGAAVP